MAPTGTPTASINVSLSTEKVMVSIPSICVSVRTTAALHSTSRIGS